MLGICNGMQALVKLGLLEGDEAKNKRTMAMAPNKDGTFYNGWEELEINLKHPTPWLTVYKRQQLHSIALPVRHGEGRLVIQNENSNREAVLERVVFRYRRDFNGSLDRIAGLTDGSGRVLGMMPHPEAATETFLAPAGKVALGHLLFQGAVEYFQ